MSVKVDTLYAWIVTDHEGDESIGEMHTPENTLDAVSETYEGAMSLREFVDTQWIDGRHGHRGKVELRTFTIATKAE